MGAPALAAMPHADDVPRLFHAARALTSPSERAAFLERACGADGALRARIETLLREWHDEAGQGPSTGSASSDEEKP